MGSWATRIEISLDREKQVKTPRLMNSSFNDQEKQAEPVSFSCWDFGHLSKTCPKSGGLIPKLALCLLIRGNEVFVFFSQVLVFPSTWNNNLSVQYSDNISVNSITDPEHMANPTLIGLMSTSFVSVFHLPYHLHFKRVFLFLNRIVTPSKEWTQDYENKIDIKY